MVAIGTLGLVTFPSWPLTGWHQVITSTSGDTTITGGSEGLSISVDGLDTPVILTDNHYDANNATMTIHFPSTQPADTVLLVGYSLTGGGQHIGWRWDSPNGMVQAVNYSDIVWSVPITSGQRWFRVETSPGTASYSVSSDGQSWTHLDTEQTQNPTLDHTYDGVQVSVESYPQTQHNTSGLISIQFQGGTQTETTTTGITQEQLNAALADWLDVQVGTQVNSAPLLGYTQHIDILGVANGIQTYLNTVLGTVGEFAATDWKKIVTVIGTILGLLNQVLDLLNGLKNLFGPGNTPQDHTDDLSAHRFRTEPLTGTLPDFIHSEIGGITELFAHGEGIDRVPTLVGETDWSGTFRWDQPADFYLVTINTVDDDAGELAMGNETAYSHIGFAVPLTDEGYPEYGPRLAISTQVIRTGRQMGGIILSGSRVLSAHIQAYQYL